MIIASQTRKKKVYNNDDGCECECERKYIKASAIYLSINIRRIIIAEGKLYYYYYFIIAERKLMK